MYHNILVPIAFDDERDISGALKAARILATPEATITLLHVIEQMPGYAISYLPAEFMNETRVAIEAEIRKLADDVPGGQAIVIEGHAGRSILDWVETNSPDLIVIASHRPGLQNLLMGSTATQVVRHAACAVHVLR